MTPATDLWVMTVGAEVTQHWDVPLDGTVRIGFNVSGLLSPGLFSHLLRAGECAPVLCTPAPNYGSCVKSGARLAALRSAVAQELSSVCFAWFNTTVCFTKMIFLPRKLVCQELMS